MIGQRNLEESDSNYHKGAVLFESTRVSIHTYRTFSS